MRTLRYSAPLLLMLAACATTAPHETGFLDRSVVVNGHTYPYVVYVPHGYSPLQRLPVILSLHGAGERGSDGVRQMQIGVAKAIRTHPELVPAIAVFPQAPENSRWLADAVQAAMDALDRTLVEFRGDPDRVYLSGLSMGGYGTYHLALAYPGRFAALAPVCGGLLPHASTTAVQRSPLIPDVSDPYAWVAHRIRQIPIWIFHGDQDPVIPVDESRSMVAALRAEGAPVRYTELSGVGHNAWDPAYGDAALWSWLFAQRRTSLPEAAPR